MSNPAIRPLISYPGPGTNPSNLYTQMAITVNELINQVVAGGGTVTHTGALTLGQLIVGNGGGDIKVGNLSGDVTTSGGTATTLASVVSAGTNTKITYNAKGLVTAGASAILASSDFANQGTTTTVLHGNAAGNPSFGQIVNADITNSTIDLTAKVTGTLPLANGGLGSTTGAGVIAAGARVDTDESTNSTTYTNLATSGPSVTLTTGTTALIWTYAQVHRTGTGGAAVIAVDISGATSYAANDAESVGGTVAVSGTEVFAGRVIYFSGLTAGSNTFTLKYRVDATAPTYNFLRRTIAVLAL